jgi:hypothetical protein
VVNLPHGWFWMENGWVLTIVAVLLSSRSGKWIPVVIGVVIALVVHLVKSAVRPAANVATAGVAAPVLSTVEDVTSVGLVIVALLLPALVLVFVLALACAAWSLLRRRRRLQEARPDPADR